MQWRCLWHRHPKLKTSDSGGICSLLEDESKLLESSQFYTGCDSTKSRASIKLINPVNTAAQAVIVANLSFNFMIIKLCTNGLSTNKWHLVITVGDRYRRTTATGRL